MPTSARVAPFVARESELRRIDELVGRAADGEPGLLVVGADAGVGKTRLVAQAAAAARERGATVVEGHCVDLGSVGIPYLALTEALGRLREVTPVVDEVAAERPALARLLDAAAGDEPGVRLQLLDGMAAVLARAGRPGAPLVLVLEDAHWADTSTLEVLRFLVARMRDEHALVVVTYRADDLHHNHPLVPTAAELSRHPRVSRIDLAPFSGDELRAFTTAVAGAPLPEAVFEDVRRRCAGNAYLAEELVASGVRPGGLPGSLADVLRARVQRLAPPVRRVVQVASAAGRVVPEPLLRAVLARPVLEPAPRAGTASGAVPGGTHDARAAADHDLREAVAHQALHAEEGGRLAFRHALLAEAVYADLLPGDRLAVHRAYLDALLADPALGSAAVRAHHALRAEDLPTTLVASRDAARDAARVLAPAEAHRHLEQVLDLWDRVPDPAGLLGEDRGSVALAAADAASHAGELARAVELARPVVDGVADPLARARLEHVLAAHLFAAEAIPEMLARTGAALGVLADDEPSRERAWTYAQHARAALNTDRFELAGTAARHAVAEARALGAPDVEADALTTLAVLEIADRDASFALLEEARERAAAAGDVETEIRCRFNLMANRFHAGHLDDAARLADEALDWARETGLTWSMYGMTLRLYAEINRYVRGDLTPRVLGPFPAVWDAGLRTVGLYGAVARGDEDAIERGRAVRPAWEYDGQVALVAGGCTADALLWRGETAAALTLLDEVVDHLVAAWGKDFLGRIWLHALALAGLADEAERAALAGADGGVLRGLVARGDDYLAVAERTAVDGLARGGDDAAEELGPEGVAWLVRARAEHARLRGAARVGADDPALWEEAVRAFGFGYRYEVARSRWRWAGALVAAGDREAARRELAAAVAEADALGARPLADACRALARRARLDAGGVRADAPGVLTDREAEVLRLVARGLSNRQIGERLFISGKTVSVHVSNVLAKLGASGRTEAVSVAHRRGLLTLDERPARG